MEYASWDLKMTVRRSPCPSIAPASAGRRTALTTLLSFPSHSTPSVPQSARARARTWLALGGSSSLSPSARLVLPFETDRLWPPPRVSLPLCASPLFSFSGFFCYCADASEFNGKHPEGSDRCTIPCELPLWVASRPPRPPLTPCSLFRSPCRPGRQDQDSALRRLERSLDHVPRRRERYRVRVKAPSIRLGFHLVGRRKRLASQRKRFFLALPPTHLATAPFFFRARTTFPPPF